MNLRSTIKTLGFGALRLIIRPYCLARRRRVMVFCRYPAFHLKAAAIAEQLRQHGFAAGVRFGFSLRTRALLRASPDLWIGFWHGVPLADLPESYIFVNVEPLGVDEWGRNQSWFEAMRGAHEVWSYTEISRAPIEALGVPFVHFPMGYARYYEENYRTNLGGREAARDIDVLFVGHLNDRRALVIEQARARGVDVCVVDRSSAVYGPALDELLARSKILLGIHRFHEPHAQIPDFARIDYALSNGLFVLHERPATVVADAGFERHVATCSYEGVPDACLYFLARPEERSRYAEASQAWFRSEYALDSFIPYERISSLLGKP